MIRYLKALGLAMLAAFALGALAAAGASAQETEGHLTSDGPVTLTGKENLEGTNAFTAFGAEVQCPESEYTGHAVLDHEGTTTGEIHQPLTSGETEITVTPHYNEGEGCNNGGEASRTIDTNGCDFRYYDFTTPDETAGTYTVDIDIVCPPEQEITITEAPCVVHVPAQTGLTGLHATNEANKVRLSGAVGGITAKMPCIGAHMETAEWHTDVVVEGREVGCLSATTAISISD